MAEKMAECEKNRGRARSIKKRDGRERKKSRGGQIKYYTSRLSTKYERDALFFSIIRWSALFHRSRPVRSSPGFNFSFSSSPCTLDTLHFLLHFFYPLFFFLSLFLIFFPSLLFLWYLRTSRIFLLFN